MLMGALAIVKVWEIVANLFYNCGLFMSSQVIADNHSLYQAHERDTLLSEVVASVCILLPGAFVVAGFGTDGTVLIIKNNVSSQPSTEWDLSFFEYEFLNEPLLAIPSQLKAVYIASEQTLPIPDALYDADALALWMNSLHHFPATSLLDTYSAAADQLHYAYVMPEAIHELTSRYFSAAKMLPAAAYQFFKPKPRKEAHMQCLISDHSVIATLRIDGKLLWHQVFNYTTPEDIAWQFTHICKSHHIHAIDLNVEATTLSDRHFDTLLELETFFPKISWSERQLRNEGPWAPAIFLMQQLYACAL